MISTLLDHLWQSTLCVGVASLLALLVRRNSARIRYWLWFAASIKFLVPFVLLVNLGRALVPLQATPQLSDSFRLPAGLLSQGLTMPFAQAIPALTERTVPWQALIIAIWSLGALLAVTSWGVRWWRMRLLVRLSRPLPMDAPIPVRSSPGLLEPGLVGIVNPVLLLPHGLVEQLAPGEFQMILAHELCHLRRRDNLTYAMHLLNCAVFWFYPLLWWLGRRLVAERERACDEAVLASGCEPAVYGDTVLKVCRHYIAAPLVGTASMAGADLQGRIQRIMSSCDIAVLNVAQRALLIGAVVIVVSTPALLGACASAPVTTAPAPTATEHERLLFEQTRPQKVVPFDPKNFDKFVGYYRSEILATAFFHIYRNGGRYYSQITGQIPVEIFPESSSEFFATLVAAQISFDVGAGNKVTELVLHQNGRLVPWQRVSTADFEAVDARLRQRITNNVPSPGTEDSIRRFIEAEQNGRPNYEEMIPPLAAENRSEQPGNMQRMQRLGALQSLKFVRVNPMGMDTYLATFAQGQALFAIAPLDADGKVAGRSWRLLP